MLLLSLLVVRLCTRCITRYVESIKKYHSMVLGLPLLIFQCVWTRISARRVALNIYSLRSPQRMLCSNAGVKLPGENHDQVSNVITLSSMHSLSPMFQLLDRNRAMLVRLCHTLYYIIYICFLG